MVSRYGYDYDHDYGFENTLPIDYLPDIYERLSMENPFADLSDGEGPCSEVSSSGDDTDFSEESSSDEESSQSSISSLSSGFESSPERNYIDPQQQEPSIAPRLQIVKPQSTRKYYNRALKPLAIARRLYGFVQLLRNELPLNIKSAFNLNEDEMNSIDNKYKNGSLALIYDLACNAISLAIHDVYDIVLQKTLVDCPSEITSKEQCESTLFKYWSALKVKAISPIKNRKAVIEIFGNMERVTIRTFSLPSKLVLHPEFQKIYYSENPQNIRIIIADIFQASLKDWINEHSIYFERIYRGFAPFEFTPNAVRTGRDLNQMIQDNCAAMIETWDRNAG